MTSILLDIRSEVKNLSKKVDGMERSVNEIKRENKEIKYIDKNTADQLSEELKSVNLQLSKRSSRQD